ncbi:hypothetical protein AHAS_Ahas15G0332900 [Arachis hypogaea]
MRLWNEWPLALRDILINEQAARNAIIDMAEGLAAITEMKKRLSSQPPINVSSDRISSSATISCQSQSQRVEESGEGQVLGKGSKLLSSWTNISRMKMLLHFATYVRNAKVEILSLHSNFLLNDKMIADANTQIQKLNTSITTLQGKQTSLENKVKILKESKTASNLKGENMKK